MRRFGLLPAFLAALTVPEMPASAAARGSVATRAGALVELLNGKPGAQPQFAPSFLAQVPQAQVTAIASQLLAQMGAVKGVAAIRMEGADAASVDFAYAKGTVTMRMVVEASPPHLVTGLLVTATKVDGDSFAALSNELRAMPGASGLAVMRLDGALPTTISEFNGGKFLAIGSAIKLYILAELMRAIEAREKSWDTVVPLTSRSLPSGIMQDWPKASPVTLHTLAALMISQSDNSATDTLIDALGRGKVESMLAAAGHSDPARNMPFLTTGEAFLLKGRGGAALLSKWIAGDVAARRAMLVELGKIDRARFDYGSFTGPPRAIDAVEWFATPQDMARVLDWIRRNDARTGGKAGEILAINRGIGAAAGDYRYVGYKGGSEAGVISLNYLVQAKTGAWYAVSGSWNDPKSAVEELKFANLISRAVALAAK